MDTNAGEILQKPPFGVQPRKFWLTNRAHGLSVAIARQYDQEPSKVDTQLCREWTSELDRITLELGKIQQEAELETAARNAAKEAERRATHAPPLKQTTPKTLEEARGMVPEKRDKPRDKPRDLLAGCSENEGVKGVLHFGPPSTIMFTADDGAHILLALPETSEWQNRKP